ncbi:MAG: DUF488 family protein [Acidimicrobiales bacterium]
MRLLTVGHGTLSAGELTELLTGAGVCALVDVRTAPGSRRNPQFNRVELARWLPEAGITYRWCQALGGFRKVRPDSSNVVLRNDSFRGYADYMESSEFALALDELLDGARTAAGPSCVMCAETLWWRCHRRLIADAAVVLKGAEVEHLMHSGQLRAHVPTPGVRRRDGYLVYDVVAG